MAIVSRFVSSIGAVALAACAAISSAAPAAASQTVAEKQSEVAPDPRPWSAKVDPGLLAEGLTSGATLDCIVVFREPPALAGTVSTGIKGKPRRDWIARTTGDLDREYAAFGARTITRYSFLPLARMAVPAAFLPALAGDPRVDAVAPIRAVHALDAEGKALMNVPAVQAQGFTGAGIGIAILDTGVDYTHPELSPVGVKTIRLKDTVNNDDDPMDDDGHGTSCAGIAAGSFTGTAPGATVVAVKVLDDQGNSQNDSVLAGIDAVLASVNGGNPYNIRVASMSFGGYDPTAWPPKAGTCDDVSPDYFQAFQSLHDAGVLPIVAAGNGGCTVGVAWPACLSNALAVGAVFDANLGFRSYSKLNCAGGTCSNSSTGADIVACYSDSGDKLDVWAPAGCATAPSLGGGTEACFDGTSAATPYVAGVAALIGQAVPNVSTTDLRAAIRETGKDITDSRNSITRKRVDAAAALLQLGGACAAPAVPTGVGTDKATSCAGQSIVVSWTQVQGAASYTVQVATDASFGSAQSFNATTTSFTYVPSSQTPQILYFRVGAAAACGSSSAYSTAAQVNYNPQCGSPYGKLYLVSGIGHLHGVKPAFWYSDLAVFNPGDSAAQARVTFHGASLTTDPADITLPAHQQLTWSDVLVSLFGLAGEDVGALTVESTQPLQVVARTYSRVADTCTGVQKTYGQSYDGVEPSSALAPGQVGYLVNLRSDSGFRTNVEFVNAGAIAASVEVRFFNNGGAPIGSALNRGLTPGERVAITAALPSGQSAAFAEVRVTPSQSLVIGFASVIDGASTDPTTIPMLVTGLATGAATTSR
jgi:subtilisin family serine protease